MCQPLYASKSLNEQVVAANIAAFPRAWPSLPLRWNTSFLRSTVAPRLSTTLLWLVPTATAQRHWPRLHWPRNQPTHALFQSQNSDLARSFHPLRPYHRSPNRRRQSHGPVSSVQPSRSCARACRINCDRAVFLNSLESSSSRRTQGFLLEMDEVSQLQQDLSMQGLYPGYSPVFNSHNWVSESNSSNGES